MSNRIEPLVLQWAQERGLLDYGTVQGQVKKLLEEFGELIEALFSNNSEEIQDAIGDMTVVLTILAYLSGSTLRTCYRKAYEEIKNRKGKMINGTFVKD